MGANLALTLKGLGRKVYLVSLPGHGESKLWNGKPLGHHSLEDFSRGLGSFFETLGTRVDAWGHSMGAAVVQKQFSSGWIRNSVLIGSPAPKVPLLGRFEVVQRAAKYWKGMVFWRPFHYGRDDYLSILLNESPRGEAEAFFEKTVPESGRVIAQICTGCFLPPRAVRIEQLLVVSSRGDRITPAYMGKLLYRRYRRHCPTKHMLIDGDHMKVFLKGSRNEVTAIEWSFPVLF